MALTLAIGISSVAAGAIFDKDDRHRIGIPKGSPLAAIGKVNWRGNWATGFLVSDCYVLTVRHLFHSRRSPVGRRPTFRILRPDGSYSSTMGAVVASGDLANEPRHRADDWLLISLDSCLGRDVGFLNMVAEEGTAELYTTRPVRTAGYPWGAANWLVMDPECRIHHATELEWFNDCASLRGNSGSPIFRQVRIGDKEQLFVIGMQTSGWNSREVRTYHSRIANRATKSHLLAKAIAPHINERHSEAGQD